MATRYSDRLGIGFGVSMTHCGLEIKKESKDCWWLCDKWLVVLTRNRKTWSFDFFTGIGHRKPRAGAADWEVGRAMRIADGRTRLVKTDENYCLAEEVIERGSQAVHPELDAVLYCLVTDGEACSQDFEDWCSNLGYDVDSRKAYSTWEACRANGKKLRDLGIDLEDAREKFSDY